MEMTTINIDKRKNLDLRTGDTVRVYQKVKDKDGKTRLQVFEGMVIARKHGREAGATFTVRRVSGGYGVEKIFPLYSPMIDKIEITKRSKVRRSKLYHIRETAIKQIRKRMKMMFVDIKEEEPVVEELPVVDNSENTQSEETVKDEEVKTDPTSSEAPVEETETPKVEEPEEKKEDTTKEEASSETSVKDEDKK